MTSEFPFLLDFKIYKGTDFRQVFNQSVNNAPRNLTGFEYSFRARHSESGAIQLFNTSVVGNAGRVEFSLSNEDVNQMESGVWLYNVFQTDSSGLKSLFCTGSMEVVNTM